MPTCPGGRTLVCMRVHARGWGAKMAFDLRWRPHGTFVMSLLKPRGAGEVADFDRSCERKKRLR